MIKFLDTLAADTPNIIAIELKRILASRHKEAPLRILDVGAGSGEIWKRVERRLTSNFGAATKFELTLFDANPVDEETWNFAGHKVVRKLGMVPSGLAQFRYDDFDLVVALDLIEHLTKSDGYRLLYHLNRLTECSVVQTPNGFLWQPPFAANPFQAHISGWKPSELKALGWRRQYGLGGSKLLVGIGGRPRYLASQSVSRKYLRLLEKVSIHASRILLSRFPSIHGEFIAVRRKREFDLEGEGIGIKVAK
jgi:SAM-dependent methyltransferase